MFFVFLVHCWLLLSLLVVTCHCWLLLSLLVVIVIVHCLVFLLQLSGIVISLAWKVIETSDIVFATDSVPAVLGITNDFIVAN